MLKGCPSKGTETLSLFAGAAHAQAAPVGIHVIGFIPVLCGQRVLSHLHPGPDTFAAGIGGVSFSHILYAAQASRQAVIGAFHIKFGNCATRITEVVAVLIRCAPFPYEQRLPGSSNQGPVFTISQNVRRPHRSRKPSAFLRG